MSESVLYNEIINKLERKNKREYAVLALSGAIITLLITVSCFFIFTLAESVFHFSSGARTVMFFMLIIISLSSAAFLFILPLLKYFKLFRKTDYFRTASDVGKYYPSIKDELLNAMQLVSGKNMYYSPVLINAAFRNVYEKSRNIRFEEVVNFRKVKELIKYSAAALFIMLMFIIFIPGLQAASSRLYNFQQGFTSPPEFNLTVYPGNAQIAKGENLTIKIIAKGKIPKELFIAYKSEEQANYESEKIISDSSGVFEYNFNSIRSSLNYYAFSGNIKSSEYLIEVTDKPVIKNFEVVIHPPAYAGLPEIVQKDNGNITALLGSVVNIRLSSNKELQKAEFNFSDSVSKNLDVQYSSASGKFNIRTDGNYKIILTDIPGNHNESPIIYSITALQDELPFIEMTEPAQDVSLSNDNRLPLGIKISDDYGFNKLILNYRLSDSRYEKPADKYSSVELSVPKNQEEADIAYIWNLSSMSLGTDDVISYYVEVFDNDRVSGPKSSKTAEYKIRVPSLDEILAEADKKHNQVENELEKTLKEAEELKKTLNKIDDDLKQDKKELTWQEKEKIENALDKFEQLQEKIKNSSEEMSELQKDLQKNNLLSKETLEKYLELQKLFEELSGEEFKKAMEKMRDMLQKMDRKTAQDALENMKINEENFKKNIERTINLLKRVRIEQKMDELVKRSEEINKELEELMKENEKSQNSQQKQENMSEQMKDLAEEMEKLQKEMEGMEDMPEEEMEKIADEIENQKNDELSKEAAENMKQNKMQQAKQNQMQMSKNMKNLSQKMQNLQQQMMQQNQMQTFSDMMKILENLITLSKQQEELMKSNQNHNEVPTTRDAEKQGNLQKSLDNLVKELGNLSQKTFAVTPEMGKALGDARREMMKSMQAIQSRNSSYAANTQGEAMKSLNEAASIMQSSMESMMQGGGQGGMSLMQQLGQMAQQQMGLNNLTQKLQQGNQGQLSPSEQAELQRIQQQQDLIKKSLEQLNREAKLTGESRKIPSSLENIAKEMEEVISDMNTQHLDDKLIQKQERILSRLLDASRSLNERDFEKQRESFTGENVVRKSPSGLSYQDKDKEKLRDELNRAVNEGYRKDYENLIKRYFEELSKENNQQKSSAD